MSKEDFISYPSLSDAPPLGTGYTQSSISATFSAPPATQSCFNVSSKFTSLECGVCGKAVDAEVNSGKPFVYLSCRHLMHLKCFADAIAKTPLSNKCNENFGGPTNCTRCLSHIPTEYHNEVLIDREKILQEYRAGFSKKYGAYNGPSDDEDLTVDQKRLIMGIKPSFLFSDKTDYSVYGRRAGCKRSDELVDDLRQRNRTLEEIFAAPKVNAHHLFKFGITSMEDLLKLGFNSATHGTLAYRDRCPYWMLCDLFAMNKDIVFKNHTGDSLLAVGYSPKELWLCGVTMQSLIDHGLTKRGFLTYKKTPLDVVTYLELTQFHLNRLGVTHGEMPAEWHNAALTERKIKVILDSLKK